MAPIYPLYTDCILDFEALCRLTDFYVDFNLNINRIIQLDDKAPQNLKYNLYINFQRFLKIYTNNFNNSVGNFRFKVKNQYLNLVANCR